MLIATIGLMPPASTRFGLLVHKPLIGPGVLFALLLSVIVFDIAVRRKPYAATLVACLLTAAVFPYRKLSATHPS